MILILSLLIYLPIFIDTPPQTLPELKSLLIGEKVSEGDVPYLDLVDSTAPLTSWFYAFMDILFGRSLLARHIVTFFIVFGQAAYLGLIFIDKKVFPESNYVPSFLFIVLYIFSFDLIVLSGELLGLGFLLLAVNVLLKELEFRNPRLETVLYLGIYIGLASLFELSYIVYLLAVCIVVLLYSRRNFGSFMLLLTGFILPHAFLMSVYFLFDGASLLWESYYLTNLSFSSEKLISWNSLLMLGVIPIVYLTVSLVMINRETRFTKYQSQLLQVMFFWIIFSCLSVLYSKNLRPQSFISVLPAVTFFLTHFFLHFRRKRLAEIYFWLLLIGVISVSFLARYNYFEKIKYDDLVVHNKNTNISVKDKNLLVLDKGLYYYINNKLASPFLDWQLSEEIFKNPDYFENVIKVNDGLLNDPPEVIYDPNQYMPAFLNRLPMLRNRYRKEGAYYYSITSN